jgi:long-chain fatty acid transport protein
VPPSQTFLNILAPGVVQDHVALGATYTTRSGVEITGFAMHAPKRRVEGRGSIPASFGGGEADIHLGETSIGLSFGKRF